MAVEAYFAQHGEVPTVMDDLVGDYLREPVASYALMPGGELERQTGVPCRTGNAATEEPAAIETIEEALAYLGGDQFVAEAGGIECATEIAVIMLAGQEYTKVNGVGPAELADLDDFLERKITRWVWQPENETLVPAAGSGCIDAFGEGDGPSDTAGETVETLPAQPTATLPQPTYTLEVHSDGCGVFRSGKIGDDLTWVVKDLDGFQVLGRNAAGETQYRYFQSGTYTMALEAWGGSYYVTVSNEVTITC